MMKENAVQQMAADTVAMQAKSFEKIYGNAFEFLSPEIKNAMLLKHCMTPTLVVKWDKDELVALMAVCGEWYE